MVTSDELKEIISNHEHWLKYDHPDWANMRASLVNYNLSGVELPGVLLDRADLAGINLYRANLEGANLKGADLTGANLTGAILEGANLEGAGLEGANLRYACLTNANLTGSNLTGARLTGTDLTGADLTCAYLVGAKLIDADLTRANLSCANLDGANLTGADLESANLEGANLASTIITGANLACARLNSIHNCPYIPMTCPDEGGFFGWKRCGTAIVKLYIPADAKRSSSTGRKCRCSKAFVCDIQSLTIGMQLDSVCSDWDKGFIYKLHTFVEPEEPFCENRFIECGSGIHFYMNREEALNHRMARLPVL